jgi:hypothetical protein
LAVELMKAAEAVLFCRARRRKRAAESAAAVAASEAAATSAALATVAASGASSGQKSKERDAHPAMVQHVRVQHEKIKGATDDDEREREAHAAIMQHSRMQAAIAEEEEEAAIAESVYRGLLTEMTVRERRIEGQASRLKNIETLPNSQPQQSSGAHRRPRIRCSVCGREDIPVLGSIVAHVRNFRTNHCCFIV